jgi:hypothetical protein
MRELYKYLDIADIKKKRLEFIGHVVMMDQGREFKYLRVNRKEVEDGEDLE